MVWAMVALLISTPALGADHFRYTFEQATALSDCKGLAVPGNVQATVVSPGAGGKGRCLVLANRKPSRYLTLTIQAPVVHTRNLVLSFDYRAEVVGEGQGTYVGVLFFDEDRKQFFGSVPFRSEWQHAELYVADLHPSNKGTLRLGQRFVKVNIYGRARGDTTCRMKLWLDNIVLTNRPRQGKLTDRVRVSTANPPLFNWPRTQGRAVLEYSRDPKFPAGKTTRVELRRNWYMPPAPLKPGTWYWRVNATSELADGWSDIERIEIPPEAHRFVAGRVDIDHLARRPHPRLIDVAAERRALSAADRQRLVARAERLHREGVPDDPPVWVKGDPRWPTWIEWYGKVHGGITSRTGRRLQEIARICMLTGDRRVIEWTREMALKAASWDPNGGSAMSRGDIGAHHLLRGLNWCYDALYPYLSAADRKRLADVIAVRAGQFWRRLNPFRGNEFNNHAWLQTFGLAEAGVVLVGDVPDAADWVQYALDLYVGRFLCALGYQGEDNEGISYWSYGLWFIIDYADMMRRVCGIDLYKHPWLSKTARFPMYCAPPGAWAVSFADTGQPNHGVRGPAATARVRALAERTRDPYALWYSGAREPVDGLMPKPPVDLPQSVWYRFVGWVIFNTNLVDGRENVTFAMRSGKFFAGHQHEDLNGFVIHAYGEKLAVDSGHYDWYGSAHFKGYSTLTRAHNCILVNGQDQHSRRKGADGRIAAYFDSPAFGYTVGDVSDPDVYDGQVKRFDRRVLFAKPGFVVIHDVLEAADGPARWDWLLHTVADIAVDAKVQAFGVRLEHAALTGRFLAPGDVGFKVTKGYPVDPVDRYSTRPVPPERWVDEWTLTATPRQKRKAEDFLVVMAIDRDRPREHDIKRISGRGCLAAAARDGRLRWLFASRLRDAHEMTVAAMATDAQFAALATDGERPVRAFMADGTRLDFRGRRLLSCSARASASWLTVPGGVLVTVRWPDAARLAFECEMRPAAVLVDGKRAAGWRYDAARHEVEVRLPAGEHHLACGRRPAELVSRELPALTVTAGARTSRLQGYARRTADEMLYFYWGQVRTPASDFYLLRTDPGGSRTVAARIDERPVGDDAVWLDAGAHWLTITSRHQLSSAALEGQGVKVGDAEMLPKSFAPPAGSIIVEAEKVDAEGEVKGRAMKKVGASGGLAHCVWDTLGQWAQWRFSVPRAGLYELLIRGAGVYDNVLRRLLLDGRPLTPDGGVVRMGATGGWCRTSDDWRYFRVPARVQLSAGEHVLRMEQLGRSMNVDLFAWVPVK